MKSEESIGVTPKIYARNGAFVLLALPRNRRRNTPLENKKAAHRDGFSCSFQTTLS